MTWCERIDAVHFVNKAIILIDTYWVYSWSTNVVCSIDLIPGKISYFLHEKYAALNWKYVFVTCFWLPIAAYWLRVQCTVRTYACAWNNVFRIYVELWRNSILTQVFQSFLHYEFCFRFCPFEWFRRKTFNQMKCPISKSGERIRLKIANLMCF